jgi:acyl carrier protein
MTVVERVGKSFAEAFGVPAASITEKTTPQEVQKWDSIGHMNLVAAMEAEFGLQFEVDEIMEMATVAKILEILAKRGVK